MLNKLANTKFPINRLLSKRWSPRIFNPSRKVSNEQLIRICEAGRWAPSCSNEQPYKYIIWNRFTNKVDFEIAFGTLSGWNKEWVKNCPILILAIADTKFTDGNPNNWAEYDTGASSENMCLQATDLGLFAHQMAGYDSNKIANLFNIPPRFKPMAMIAIGYKSEDYSLVHEKYQKTEKQERERQPLKSNFFNSKWNNPLI